MRQVPAFHPASRCPALPGLLVRTRAEVVLHDVWGLDTRPAPRFVRRYIDGERVLTDALNEFNADVKELKFPEAAESYP